MGRVSACSSFRTGIHAAEGLRSLVVVTRCPRRNFTRFSGHLDPEPLGGFNWSSQHLELVGVFDGGDGGLEQEDQRCSRGRAAAVACGSGAAPGDASAGFTDAVAGGAAAVLASDRHGHQFS